MCGNIDIAQTAAQEWTVNDMRTVCLDANMLYAEHLMYKNYLDYSGETDALWIAHLKNCLHVALFKEVTDRQREVLELFMQGYTQTEIAGMLNVNKFTISRTMNRALTNVARVLKYSTPRTLSKPTVSPEYLGSTFASGKGI